MQRTKNKGQRKLATNELVPFDGSRYPALTQDLSELGEVMAENVRTGTLRMFDLPRIKIPTGGGTAFQVEQIDSPRPKSVDELHGIIVGWADQRVYWEDSDSMGKPPDCASADAKVGIGNPGGPCDICPMAEFGSKPGSRGQACKLTRVLLFLQDGSLPSLILAPPTSQRNIGKYFLQLTSKGLPYRAVETILTLEPMKNNAGQPYSVIVPQMGAKLDLDLAARAKAYSQIMTPAILGNVVVGSTD